MDEKGTIHKGNEREKKKELVKIAQKDQVLSSIISSWELTKPVDIMMADRMVNIWRNIKRIEKLIKKQGYVVGIPPTIQAHPLLVQLKDLNASLLAFYRTFEKKIPKENTKDFADWIEQN